MRGSAGLMSYWEISLMTVWVSGIVAGLLEEAIIQYVFVVRIEQLTRDHSLLVPLELPTLKGNIWNDRAPASAQYFLDLDGRSDFPILLHDLVYLLLAACSYHVTAGILPYHKISIKNNPLLFNLYSPYIWISPKQFKLCSLLHQLFVFHNS